MSRGRATEAKIRLSCVTNNSSQTQMTLLKVI